MYAEGGGFQDDSGVNTSSSSSHQEGGSFYEEEEDLGDEDPVLSHRFEENPDSPEPDLYASLGVARDASVSEIKAAYHRWSRLLHPDKHVQHGSDIDNDADISMPFAEEQYERVLRAYKILTNPKDRGIYDYLGYKGRS